MKGIYMILKGKRIAVFVAPMYEDLEFWYPYYRLKEEGAEVLSVGPDTTVYNGKHGMPAKPDKVINDIRATDFDAVVIPGGYSPDYMRRTPAMIEFIKEMDQQDKPIAAICHGPWILASADVIRDKQVTSFYSIRDDIINAGGRWEDSEVVKSDNIVTSRQPKDLPAFCKTLIEMVSQVPVS
jgi:protease I